MARRKRHRHRTEYISRRATETERIECKCPKCGVLHVRRVNYTGKGTPWYACKKHRELFSTDDGELNYHAMEPI